jgi:DNA processing protein
LAAKAGLDLRTVLRRLTLLEMTGLVVRRDGEFALAPPPKRTDARATPEPDHAPASPMGHPR